MPTVAPQVLPFEQAARLAAPGDNTAIAIRRLPGRAMIAASGHTFSLSHPVLEGHRFAVIPIRKGERLVSWGLPFGLALRDVCPGEYLCNQKILVALRGRSLDLHLPDEPNFQDYRLPVHLNEAEFRPGTQVSSPDDFTGFHGFSRSAGRGVGTRNHIVLVGTSSLAGPFVRALAARFSEITGFGNVDGVVPVAHTEAAGSRTPNNRDLVLRTLAGFVTHPNAGAVLCVDFGNEPINNQQLQLFLKEHRYPIDGLLHHFLSIQGSFESALREGEAIVRDWLPRVNHCQRTPQRASALQLGLQCGGSDAFSGVSANPLLGLLSREIVARSGAANLAETSELIGAESWILENVRDLATARKFLATLDRFQAWAAAHGHSAEGNPSGGNMLRGLYNISIKSIGAARKKDPAVRLDHVIDYAEPMPAPGFYFMDSPGNDLESIAGQVAAGCNLILFATGNGSITNFPFVPTIKVMTTTGRFELVRQEMDFNAGRYLDGEPLENLGREALALLLEIASGRKSRGELAGHSQVQIWREWRQATPSLGSVRTPEPRAPILHPHASGLTLPTPVEEALSYPISGGHLGLVLPTSLCSGQVASLIAGQITHDLAIASHPALQRVVALPHTEGCGNSAGDGERLFMRTLGNYLLHPFVGRALLLEHGCEKTHNDAFRHLLRENGIPPESVGWASIQSDGGLARVTEKIVHWFREPSQATLRPHRLTLGFWSADLSQPIAEILNPVFATLTRLGCSVILSESLLTPEGTLEYGARPSHPGWHVMECPTDDPVETLTGLGAAGATLLMAWADDRLLPAHPMIPLIQLGSQPSPEKDLVLEPSTPAETSALQILALVARVHQRISSPHADQLGAAAFQITRGATGISL